MNEGDCRFRDASAAMVMQSVPRIPEDQVACPHISFLGFGRNSITTGPLP